MAEREKPGVAQQQVECTGKQGEAHELHDEHGIRTNKGAATRPSNSRPYPTLVILLSSWCGLYFSLPNRSAGRMSRTITMMTNTTVDDASG